MPRSPPRAAGAETGGEAGPGAGGSQPHLAFGQRPLIGAMQHIEIEGPGEGTDRKVFAGGTELEVLGKPAIDALHHVPFVRARSCFSPDSFLLSH